MTEEEWRPVLGYEGSYEVSSRGRVRSLDRMVATSRGQRISRGRVLSPRLGTTGRLELSLSSGGKTQPAKVHRLVAIAFVDGFAEGLEVCHNDGDPLNNEPANLRWDTRSSNAQDTVRHARNKNANKTHCPAGHEYTEENTAITAAGHRSCRRCHRDRNQRARGDAGAGSTTRAKAFSVNVSISERDEIFAYAALVGKPVGALAREALLDQIRLDVVCPKPEKKTTQKEAA